MLLFSSLSTIQWGSTCTEDPEADLCFSEQSICNRNNPNYHYAVCFRGGTTLLDEYFLNFRFAIHFFNNNYTIYCEWMRIFLQCIFVCSQFPKKTFVSQKSICSKSWSIYHWIITRVLKAFLFFFSAFLILKLFELTHAMVTKFTYFIKLIYLNIPTLKLLLLIDRFRFYKC